LGLAAAGAAFAASADEPTCVERRPAAAVPRNFKPLYVDVEVSCPAEATVAGRRSLAAHPPAKSAPMKVRRLPHLYYYGGPIVSNVKVVALRWNAAVPADHSTAMEGFYRSFASGAMWDWLSEYDTVGLTAFADGLPGSEQRIGHGSFAGTYTMTPAAADGGPKVTDTQITAELSAHIASGAIPRPEVDAQGNPVTVYMIDFPDSVQIDGGGILSCHDFCAYHSSVRVNGVRAAYGVLPAIAGGCLVGCGTLPSPFDVATVSASHELVEAVTDPAISEVPGPAARPAAWYDPQLGDDEIADICGNGARSLAMLDGYWVQGEWSNRWRSCVVAPPPGALP
jgi:hypothetical protein